MSSGDKKGRCYWVFVPMKLQKWVRPMFGKIYSNWNNRFSGSDEDNDDKKPDGHGSNGGIKSSIGWGGEEE
jgi:hypothetical protein